MNNEELVEFCKQARSILEKLAKERSLEIGDLPISIDSNSALINVGVYQCSRSEKYKEWYDNYSAKEGLPEDLVGNSFEINGENNKHLQFEGIDPDGGECFFRFSDKERNIYYTNIIEFKKIIKIG